MIIKLKLKLRSYTTKQFTFRVRSNEFFELQTNIKYAMSHLYFKPKSEFKENMSK